MKIRLLHSYSGALTNERRMAEGEHEVTTELGNYLVDNGHAIVITPVTPEPLPLAVDPDSDVDPLPEITEDVVTQERTFTPKPKGKR